MPLVILKHFEGWKTNTTITLGNNENLHRTGERDSWRAQTKLVAHQDTGKMCSDPTIN